MFFSVIKQTFLETHVLPRIFESLAKLSKILGATCVELCQRLLCGANDGSVVSKIQQV